MEVDGKRAAREEMGRDEPRQRRRRPPVWGAREAAVHVAAIQGRDAPSGQHGGQVQSRQDDHRTGKVGGVQPLEQAAGDDLAFVFVAVVAAGDQNHRPRPAAHHAHRHRDGAEIVPVVGM